MDACIKHRYEVVEAQAHSRGELYELEQTTTYHVLDMHTGEIVMAFASRMEASLSRDNGQWDDIHFSGVSEVSITADGYSVMVKYHDGREESFPLPV